MRPASLHSRVPRKNYSLSDFHCQIKEHSLQTYGDSQATGYLFLDAACHPCQPCDSWFTNTSIYLSNSSLMKISTFQSQEYLQICLLVAFQLTGSDCKNWDTYYLVFYRNKYPRFYKLCSSLLQLLHPVLVPAQPR